MPQGPAALRLSLLLSVAARLLCPSAIGQVSDLLSVAGKYFIESLGYSRKPGESLFTVRCVDAWGLLERYAFNRPVEWNSAASDFTVYDLIGKVVAAWGVLCPISPAVRISPLSIPICPSMPGKMALWSCGIFYRWSPM